MAVLRESGIVGKIDSLLIHPEKEGDITSVACESVSVSFEGFAGDSHSGLTRESCVRVREQYKEGTIIRNTRQISIVSTEELAHIAGLMEISAIKPEHLGANICVSGIPDLSLLPLSSRLLFSGGVSLVVDMQNEPCKYPAQVIDNVYPGRGKYFIKHAFERRGVTAWVEREGQLPATDTVAVHIPLQSKYVHFG